MFNIDRSVLPTANFSTLSGTRVTAEVSMFSTKHVPSFNGIFNFKNKNPNPKMNLANNIGDSHLSLD